MIANSQGFEFKETTDNRVITPELPTQNFNQSTEVVPDSNAGGTNLGISAGEAQTFFKVDSALHSRGTTVDTCDGQYFEDKHFQTHPISNRETSEHVSLPQDLKGLYEANIDPVPCSLPPSYATFGDPSSVKAVEPSYETKCEIRWPDADEEADSSGESDDTVIDAGWRFRNTEAERNERREDGWVELSEARRQDTSGLCGGITKFEVPVNNASIQEDSSNAALRIPDSPHSESFVDLAESCIAPPSVATAASHPQSESSDDQVQETLTIEALRALAAGSQEWDSESRESSPEILCPLPQLGITEGLLSIGGTVPKELLQRVDLNETLSCKGKGGTLSNAQFMNSGMSCALLA
ncbi:uncharacterized protein RCH25_052327 [Pelodytes ibericus]